MALLSTGSDVTQRTVFNSGYLTIGTNRFVDLDSVAIEISYDIKRLSSLNSITARALKRSQFKVTLKGKIRSLNREMLGYHLGSSSVDGTGTSYMTKDGQATLINPIFTGYVNDDSTTPQVWQYQFQNAVITNLPLSAKTEDYAEMDFEMMATSINIYTSV